MIESSIFNRVCKIAGEENVSRSNDVLKAHSRDASPFPPIMPGLLVTPTSTEIVSQIVKLCNETKTPILPFGSGYSFTGLSNRRGSQTLVMDLKKMNKILYVDESNETIRAEAGIIIGNLSDQARERGYYLNTVAVPYYKDTLGGMISGVAGGGHPLYSTSTGLNNKDVISLKIVLPAGKVIETNGSDASRYPGNDSAFMRETNSPDMTGMFVGDGGIFGIKTEAVLAMHPIPPFWRAGAKLFSSFDRAYEAVCRASRSNTGQILCDYITILSPEITEIYAPDLVRDLEYCGIVYYVQGFSEGEVDAKLDNVDSIFQNGGAIKGTDALQEFSEGMRTGEVYWKINEYTESLTKRASCAFFASTASFRKIFDELCSFLRSEIQQHSSSSKLSLTPAYVVHPVLRNCMWANIILNYEKEEERSHACEIIRDLHRLAASLGITFEAHSGYAADLMGAIWSNEFREMILSVKRTLDPNNILNPDLWFTQV